MGASRSGYTEALTFSRYFMAHPPWNGPVTTIVLIVCGSTSKELEFRFPESHLRSTAAFMSRLVIDIAIFNPGHNSKSMKHQSSKKCAYVE